MPRPCSICRHPRRSVVEAALSAGLPFRTVSERFGLSPAALHRHQHGHGTNVTLEGEEPVELSIRMFAEIAGPLAAWRILDGGDRAVYDRMRIAPTGDVDGHRRGRWQRLSPPDRGPGSRRLFLEAKALVEARQRDYGAGGVRLR